MNQYLASSKKLTHRILWMNVFHPAVYYITSDYGIKKKRIDLSKKVLMMSENKEVKTVICVLLPFCMELETDVFLNLLRNVVARSRLDDQQLDILKAGMIADTLCIKSDDLLVNWKELNSESQRIRQLKLLGVWTMYNYPSLGKKLFGDSWQAPERKIVDVLGVSAKSAEAVNDVIFKKMKLRIFELNISHSTLLKLKHFVRVPVDVEKFNGIQISPRIKLFEIDESVIEKCWKALKFGSFVSDKVRFILKGF